MSNGQSKTDQSNNTNKSYSISNINISENYNLKSTSTFKLMNSYTAKVSVPVFVLGHSLFFEVGINAGILHFASSTTYDYNMYRTEGYYTGSFFNQYYYTHTIAAGNGKGNLEVKDNYFIISPTFDICFETELGIQFIASCNYKYFALVCGYSL
jgi:hypothetical protein